MLIKLLILQTDSTTRTCMDLTQPAEFTSPIQLQNPRRSPIFVITAMVVYRRLPLTFKQDKP